MEKNEPSNVTQALRNQFHEKFMRSILVSLYDTPLVLKGGTALYLAYGLERFSEDLDFDSHIKLNLLNKLKDSVPKDIQIIHINVKKDTDSVSRYLIRYKVKSLNHYDYLKVEISYRTPVPDDQIALMDGIKVSSVDRIIDNKLNAAFDGENTRSKARDLYDLHFLAKNYPQHFSPNLVERLVNFARDPDKLISQYQADFDRDTLIVNADLEIMALELHELSLQFQSKSSVWTCNQRNSGKKVRSKIES